MQTAKDGTKGTNFTNDFWQKIKVLLPLKQFKLFYCCLFYYKGNNEIIKIKSSIWKYVSKFSRCYHSKFFVKIQKNCLFQNHSSQNFNFLLMITTIDPTFTFPEKKKFHF